MTPQNMAERIEKTRFELMRGQRWTDLRASEREARVDLALRALEESGVAGELDGVRRQAERVPDLEGLVARQDGDIAALESRLEADHAAHRARVADLEAQLAAARHERDRAEALVVATAAVVDAVRTLVTAPIEPAEPAHDDAAAAEHGAAEHGAAEHGPARAVLPHPADGGAQHRRPIFRMARSAPA